MYLVNLGVKITYVTKKNKRKINVTKIYVTRKLVTGNDKSKMEQNNRGLIIVIVNVCSKE